MELSGAQRLECHTFCSCASMFSCWEEVEFNQSTIEMIKRPSVGLATFINFWQIRYRQHQSSLIPPTEGQVGERSEGCPWPPSVVSYKEEEKHLGEAGDKWRILCDTLKIIDVIFLFVDVNTIFCYSLINWTIKYEYVALKKTDTKVKEQFLDERQNFKRKVLSHWTVLLWPWWRTFPLKWMRFHVLPFSLPFTLLFVFGWLCIFLC